MTSQHPRLQLHRSVTRELVAAHDDGFLDGVCHVIDELKAVGYYDAAEAMMKRLFRPSDVQETAR